MLTARKSTGGRAPRMQLATMAAKQVAKKVEEKKRNVEDTEYQTPAKKAKADEKDTEDSPPDSK